MLMRLQLLLLAVILPLGLAGPDYGQGQEPLPVFRLVEITPDQLGDEIRRQQALVAMPRSEFEELLRQVRTNSQLLANRPRLLESHYLARLEPETDSLVGEGLWTLHNPNSGPTVFRIQPWNLALRGQASLDGQPALLGELPDQTSALLLNAGGRKQVRFAWSARSLSQPDSLRYILQIPPAPVTVLDLEVPADRLVECPGHRPVPLADNRWRIVLPSSTSELEVLIRPSDFPHRTRLLTADLTSTWTLRPLFAQVRYVLDIRSLHRPLKDVVVQLPERLEILDVIRLPPTAPPLACSRPDPQTLVLAVSEPAQRHLTIEVQARLPLSPDGAFSFPVPVVKDAWLEPENLRIRFLQGMNPAGWDLADFRLAEPPALERDAAEVYEVIRLVQTLPGSLSARRPSVQAVDSPAPLDVRQQVCWMPALTGSWMDVATRWRIGNKPVFRLAFQVPDKAQVQRAEVTGTTTDVTWFLEPPRHLVAEFREPLPPRSSVKTRLTLRLDSQDPRQVHEVPSVVPLEAQVLESGLAVFSQTATSRGRFRLTDTEAVPTTAFSLNLFDGLEHPWAGLGSRPDGFWVQRGRIVTGRLEEVPADQRRPAERAADSERKPADDIQLPKNDSETNSNQNDKSGHSILRFTDIVVTTWLEPDGRAKYEYRASIMSDREFELIGSLPESIRLETVHLGPTTLPPSLQIAVPPGNSVLRLTYYDEANRWQFLGIHQVSLPTWQDAPLPGLCRHRVILSSGQALAYPPAKDTRNSLQNWLRGWTDEAGPVLARVPSRNATLDGEEVPDTGTLASRVRIVDLSDSVGLTLIVIPRWVLHGMGMALMVGLTGSAWRLRKGRWWTMAGAVLVCLILLFALPSDLTVLGWWMLIGCLPAG
ncbi:MAG: hypothetical protein NZM31_04230, partial [Gemmatales bacterium]|nr:hypothetical protein [Gemmatales bacterium]MDW8386208.1 hypothetical protein [Gemmatales bacterium]